MPYRLELEIDTTQYAAAQAQSTGAGDQSALIALTRAEYQELLKQTDYPVVWLLIKDSDDQKPELDVRQYTDRHSYDPWEQLGHAMLASRVWCFVVSKPLAVNNKAMKAVDASSELLRAYGARTKQVRLNAGDSITKHVADDSLRDFVEPSDHVTGTSLDRVQGRLFAGDGNRETLLFDVRDRVLAVNEARETLFMSNATLVQVYEGKISPIRSGTAFATWAALNDVQFYNYRRNDERRALEVELADEDDDGLRYVLMPNDTADYCCANPDIWQNRMLKLSSVSRLPFVHQDGSFISKYGYDRETQAFIADESVSEFEPLVPETVSQEDARKAANWLLTEVLIDFPFVTTADRDNALGLMLAGLTRYVHQRPMPLFGVTAPDAGTGKGLLTDVLSMILQGQGPDLRVLSTSDEEQKKAITGVLMESSNPVVVWDNVPTGSKLSNPVLCALHTALEWSDRVLGSSSSITLANDRVWVATGNNIGPAEDLVRRWVHIGLDAGTPHPEQRSGFRHKALKEWVLEHRTECVVALLTMVRGWDQAGRPKPSHPRTPVMGDYQPIINTVGGILNFAGCDGFWMNQSEVQEKAAEGSVEEIAEEFLHWLYTALPAGNYHRGAFSAKQVGKLIEQMEGGYVSAQTCAVPLPPRVLANLKDGGQAFAVSLGHWMTEVAGRRFGGEKFRVRRLQDRKVERGAAWVIDAELEPSTHPMVEVYLRQRQEV